MTSMKKVRTIRGVGACVVLLGIFANSAIAAPPTDLFISEYIEGSSNNKAIEIYNGTGASVNLGSGGYQILIYSNGSVSVSTTINLTGTIATGDVFVIANSSANATILAQADQTTPTSGAGSLNFNGNDAVALKKTGSVTVDVIGQVGVNPGTEWGTGLVSTADNTIRRKSAICTGDTIDNDVFDPSIQWDGFALDTFSGLGSHTSDCPVQAIVDMTGGGATVNGALVADEYGPGNIYSFAGAGNGFGGMLNGATRFYMNSDTTNLYIGFQPGITFANPNNGNYVVLYLNSKSGGFTDSTMSDNADAGRNVTANLGAGGNDGFPFLADYAVVYGDFGCVMFELNGGSFNVITISSSGCGATSNFRELSVPLASIGATSGSNIDFFAAYCSTTLFNSNETVPPMPAINGGANPLNTATVNYAFFDRFTTFVCSPTPDPTNPVASNPTICPGGSSVLSVDALPGGIEVHWTTSSTCADGFDVGVANGLTVNPGATTSYYAYTVVTATGCKGTGCVGPVTVTVSNPPCVHGTCQLGNCVCDVGWGGPFCDIPLFGSCCHPNGSCSFVTSAAACDPGSIFTAGGSCTPNPCVALIPPDEDCWKTTCGMSQYDFGDTPIPGGFFDPGSEPFDGIILLGGGNPSGPDTIVRRNGAMEFPGGLPFPQNDNVPIEIIALNLVSCQPITVRYCPDGSVPDETWAVHVDLSPAPITPVPPGQMNVTKTHPNGGVFQSQFFVQPRFTFTRVTPTPGLTRVLDTGLLPIPPAMLQSNDPIPWVHETALPLTPPSCGTNFVPGVFDSNGPPSTPGCTPVGQCATTSCHAGPSHLHCVGPVSTPCPCGACANTTTGDCTIVSGATGPADCASSGGIYKGDGTSCHDSDGDGLPDCYETGAPCSGSSCAPDSPATSPTNPTNADTDGDGVNDSADIAPTNRCIPTASPLCNEYDLTVPGDGDSDNDGNCDLCEIESGASADCNFNGVPDENESGGCCTGTACAAMSAQGCRNLGGYYYGHGVACALDDGDPCTTDTCSTLNGAVTHTPIPGCCTTDANCNFPNGTCVSGTCQCAPGYIGANCQTPVGACCYQGYCESSVEGPICTSNGGTFLGAATSCTPNTCPCPIGQTRCGTSCVAPDAGGTAEYPPEGSDCGMRWPTGSPLMVNGLPPGTPVLSGPSTRMTFSNVVPAPAPPPPGHIDSFFDIFYEIELVRPGYNRLLTIPCTGQSRAQDHGVGPVQTFDTEMLGLQGQVGGSGDPDFDLLRITAGSNFGMPSPGHTTLTRLPGGNWAVDSFFDITYRIDFVGAPGGPFAGMSGSTTATIRMGSGSGCVDTQTDPQNCGSCGTVCDDGDACTIDSCVGGVCQHVPNNCDDGDPCTTDSCDPVLGCVHGPVNCDDNNPCTTDTCNPLTGCEHTPIPGCLVGACCDVDGGCTFLTAEQCWFGIFRGVGVNCGSANCPQPPVTDEFCSTAEIQFLTAATGTTVQTAVFTSPPTMPAIVKRTPPPYTDLEPIPTEMIQLELTGQVVTPGPLFGQQVLIHERADKQSLGRLNNVDANLGGFVQADSFFDVFVTIDLPALGYTGNTQNTPITVTSPGITNLPPYGAPYGSGPISVPVDPVPPVIGPITIVNVTHTVCPPPNSKCVYEVTCVSGPPAGCPGVPACGMIFAQSNCPNGTCPGTEIRRIGDCCVTLTFIGCMPSAAPFLPTDGACTACEVKGACTNMCTGVCTLETSGDCGTAGLNYAGDCTFCPITPLPPVVCDDGNPCTTDTCNPATGVCTFTPTPGAPCADDGNPCTDDICDGAGNCTHPPKAAGSPCTDDGNPCTDDICDGAGNCTHPDKPNGTICDGPPSECIDHYECQNGVCVPVFKASGTPCADDGNPCTDDVCNGAGVCIHPPKADGTPCTDGNACTNPDTCIGGVCVPGAATICPPPNDCQLPGTCNPLTGVCVYPPKAAGTPCTDDGNPCTDDICDGAGNCIHPPKADGTPCTDGNACTNPDTCQAGVCSPGAATICPPPNDCQLPGTCNPLTGVCVYPPKAAGTPCTDDGNPCTDDICDGAGGCIHPPKADGTPCTDGNACTNPDTCVAGVCVPGAATICPPPDECHLPGTCNPATGVCEYPNKPDGTPCTDDGNPCTIDRCIGGVCHHDPDPACGACCATDATCTVTTPAGCIAPSTFSGPGTSCTPNPCTLTPTVNITVELGPGVDPTNGCGPYPLTLTRCIDIVFYHCTPPPTTYSTSVEMTFTIDRDTPTGPPGCTGGPYDPITATASINLPSGTWDCAIARDRLHTLARKATLTGGPAYTVSFTGSSRSLPGGNLNDDPYVDILDFGGWAGQYLVNYANGNTSCLTSPIHADISGDGLVDSGDFSFIAINYLMVSDETCCPTFLMPGVASDRQRSRPVTRISVEELRMRGMSEMARGDVNEDGVLDAADIADVMMGEMPQTQPAVPNVPLPSAPVPTSDVKVNTTPPPP